MVDDHGVYRVDVDPTYQTVRILARVPAKTPIECPRNVAYGLRLSFEGLSPEEKQEKAKIGLALGLILFILVNVIAFLV